ncbi:MAG: tetratricopeptide repeat protein [Acidobacteriota bacterium]
MQTKRRPHFEITFLLALTSIFVAVLCLSSGAIGFAATAEDDLGLLPPAHLDQDPQVAAIRKSIATRNFVDALTLTDELIRRQPGNFEGYFWRGFLELQRENGFDAVRFFRQAEALKATDWVLKSLAVAYYTVRQFKLFTMKMNEAMRQEPGDYAPYYYLGRHLLSDEIADFDAASEYFRKAIERKTDHYQSFYYLGYCFEARRNITESERCYQQSMNIAKTMPKKFSLVYEGMARLQLLQDKPADALESAKQAVELAPNTASSHKVLAKTYQALGRAADAILEWELTAKLDPTDASPYYHLYRIYLASGREADAKVVHAKFKKLSDTY